MLSADKNPLQEQKGNMNRNMYLYERDENTGH